MSTESYYARPLGLLEKLYTARHVLGVYNSVIVTTSYTLSSDSTTKSLYPTFRATLPSLVRRHAPLHLFFDGQDTQKPTFRRLARIKVEDVLQEIQLEERENLAQKLQQLHDETFSTDQKPLWKLVVMKEPRSPKNDASEVKVHVSFVYHHVIGDGLSGAAFHRTLLQELETLEQSGGPPQEAFETFETGERVLIEPIEKLVKLPLSPLFLLKKAAREYAPRWIVGDPPVIWAGIPAQTLEVCPFRSRIRIITLNANDTDSLLKKGREHKVALTSLLAAAIVCAAAEILPEATAFFTTTPYTLRRVTGISIDEMVNQTSAIEVSYDANLIDRTRKASTTEERAGNLWSVAAYFHSKMQEELSRCPRDNLIGLLPYVVDHIDFYRKKFGQQRDHSWELSNLGVFKNPQDSASAKWRAESMTFTQGAQPLGPAFNVNCAGIHGGALTLTITWQESVIKTQVVEELARFFEELPELL